MTHTEFRKLREKMGLSSYKLAPLMFKDSRTIRRYEQAPGAPGHRSISGEVADRLRTLVEKHCKQKPQKKN